MGINGCREFREGASELSETYVAALTCNKPHVTVLISAALLDKISLECLCDTATLVDPTSRLGKRGVKHWND